MSFWSKLGSLVLKGAAPFLGPAAPVALAGSTALDLLGRGAGKAAGAAAQGRASRAELYSDLQDRMERHLLQRELASRAAQQQAFRNLFVADMLKTWKPATRVAGIPTISFTTGPGETAQRASTLMAYQGLKRLLQPDLMQQAGMGPYQPLLPPADLARRFQKTLSPGFWERLAGLTAVAAPIVSRILTRGDSGSGLPGLPIPIEPSPR